MSPQRRLAEFLIRRRRAVALFAALVSFFMAAELRHFKISLDLRADLPSGDPEIEYFEEFNRKFNAREMLVVALEAPDLFTSENLGLLKSLTTELQKVSGIEQALSLANVPEIAASGMAFSARPFLDKIPSDNPAGLARIRREALAHPRWVRTLISPDGTMASINLMLAAMEGNPLQSSQITAEVRRILDGAARPGVKLYLTGVPPLLADCFKLVQSDLRRFLWITPVLVTFLLWVMFRTLRGVAASLGIISLTVLWTFGLIFTTGHSISMVTTTLPILIVVTCLSDLIYITALYYELSAALQDRREVLARTVERMIGPCLLTSLSAAIGFGSLAFSELQSVRELGIFAAAAVLIAYFLGLTILPFILDLGPPPPPALQRRYDSGRTARILSWVVRLWDRDRGLIPLGAGLCLVFSMIGLTRLKAETQVSAFLPRSAPSVQAYMAIQEKMAGFSTIEMTLSGPPGTFQQAWAIRELDKTQRFLQGLPGVNTTYSLADFVKEFNQVMSGGDPRKYAVPEESLKIAGYLALFTLTPQSSLLSFFVTPDYALARVSARIRSMSTAGHLELLRAVEDFARRDLDRRLAFRTTGIVKLYASSVTALVDGQVRSLLASIVLILLLFIVRMRSFKAGLIVMIPNILPVMLTLGLMGFIGISLNLSTVMVASIAIGFVVDDTIQILSRYRRELAAGSDVAPAMRATLMRGGRAYTFSSVIIAAGFSIISFSAFAPNRHMGILIAFTMLTALASDLVLTPCLVKRFGLKWK